MQIPVATHAPGCASHWLPEAQSLEFLEFQTGETSWRSPRPSPLCGVLTTSALAQMLPVSEQVHAGSVLPVRQRLPLPEAVAAAKVFCEPQPLPSPFHPSPRGCPEGCLPGLSPSCLLLLALICQATIL